MFHLSKQSIPLPSFQKRRKIQSVMLDCDWTFDVHSLVPRKSWWMAIRLSLRHDSSPVDVPFAHRKRAAHDKCHGDFTFRRFGSDQRNRYLAIFGDRQNPAITRMSVWRVAVFAGAPSVGKCARV